jgi:hypothetical protein
MGEFICGGLIFMAGAIFGLFVSSLAVAASREYPKQPKKED